MKVRFPRWMWIFDLGFRRMEQLGLWIEQPQSTEEWVKQQNRIKELSLFGLIAKELRFPGWIVEMFIVIGTWALSHELREWIGPLLLLRRWIGPLLLVIGSCAVFVLLKAHLLLSGLRIISKMGIRGPLRARWWIEVAALDWTLLMACIAFGLCWPFGPSALDFLLNWGPACLFCLFFPLTLIGYLLGLAQRRRIRCYSLELVNFFFWCMAGSYVAMMLLDMPMIGDLVIPLIIAAGVVLLMVHRVSMSAGLS